MIQNIYYVLIFWRRVLPIGWQIDRRIWAAWAKHSQLSWFRSCDAQWRMPPAAVLEHEQMLEFTTHPDKGMIPIWWFTTHIFGKFLEHAVEVPHGGFGLVGGQEEEIQAGECRACPRILVHSRKPTHTLHLFFHGLRKQLVFAVTGIDCNLVNSICV
jgi:hypothetical protein